MTEKSSRDNLKEYIKKNDLDAVISFFRAEQNRDKVSNTALRMACRGGNVDIILYLIDEQNADVNKLPEKLFRRLFKNGHIDLINMLVLKYCCEVPLNENLAKLYVDACRQVSKSKGYFVMHFLLAKYRFNEAGDHFANAVLRAVLDTKYSVDLTLLEILHKCFPASKEISKLLCLSVD